MFDEVPSLSPVTFFSLSGKIAHAKELDIKKAFKKPFLLPSTHELTGEDSFADIGIAWNEKGILCFVKVKKPFDESFFPNIARGDAFELFIDTKNLKTAGSPTRFCHHFVFFPKDESMEITKLRAEDSRPLADPKEILVAAEFDKKSYLLEIAIPTECLYGFEPKEGLNIGLNYRVNRHKGDPQHFATPSNEYTIEKHPSLWSTFTLE